MVDKSADDRIAYLEARVASLVEHVEGNLGYKIFDPDADAKAEQDAKEAEAHEFAAPTDEEHGPDFSFVRAHTGDMPVQVADPSLEHAQDVSAPVDPVKHEFVAHDEDAQHVEEPHGEQT